MKRIGLHFAMQNEFRPICDRLGTCIGSEQVGKFPVLHFQVKDKHIVVIVSGIGEIRAAAATQALISVFGVECVLSFGVAGGLTEKLKTFDTVFVDKVVHAGFDLTELEDYQVGQYAGFDSPYFFTDRKLLKKALSIADYPTAVCASADRFVDARDERIALARQFEADVCEMEAAGVLVTCTLNDIPALLVKTVSDSIGGGAIEYSAVVNKAVTTYCDFFSKFIEEI